MTDLHTQRDALERELDEGCDWITRARANKDWMDDPRKRQKVDRMEDQWLEKLRCYTTLFDVMRQEA